MLTSDQIHRQIISMLGGTPVAEEIDASIAWRQLKVPKKMWLGIDCCIRISNGIFLVYELETLEIPERIREVSALVANSSLAQVIVVARDRSGAKPSNPDGENIDDSPPAIRAADIAKSITKDCISMGFGLVVEGFDRLHLVFPPGYAEPVVNESAEKEDGHIPSWLRNQAISCKGLSPALVDCLKKFNNKYENAIRNDKMRYTHESHLLRDLAESISELVPRFHFPLDLLEALRSWERSGVVEKRDHFFHTFNNFFAGLIVLGTLCQHRSDTLVPETYIREAGSSLRPWEVLWLLVSLLHDPGYMSEEIGSMFNYGLGVGSGTLGARKISATDKKSIKNLWDTEYSVARKDLVHLFNLVSGRWELTGSADDLTSRFEIALREAYFDDEKCGHSLMSGLRIITECNRASCVSQQNGFNELAAKKACVIAALGMMFHDPHTREVFSDHDIPPISFELLPYAATLVFVDSLQEDRRDIREWRFPKDCIFKSLEITEEKSRAHAVVDLIQIPIKYWAWKILEFEGSLSWINEVSETKFSIDYRAARNLFLTKALKVRKPSIKGKILRAPVRKNASKKRGRPAKSVRSPKAKKTFSKNLGR